MKLSSRPGLRDLPRHLAAVASLALVAGVAGGCVGAASPVVAPSASPTPVPTATSTPTPTATPDVAAAFVTQMRSTAAGKMDVSGTMTISGLQLTISGSYAFSGSDNETVMVVSVAGQEQVTERVHVATTAWKRNSPGPWLRDTANVDGEKSLNAALSALLAVSDKGVETRNGRALHHLVPANATIPPGALGFDATVKNPRVTMEFYADSTGKPQIMVLNGTWTQAVNGKDVPAIMALEYAFTQWGGTVTIAEPTDVWTVNASKLGYSMARPADWTVATKDGRDVYSMGGQDWIHVVPQSIPTSLSTKGFHDGLLASYRTDFGTPDTDTAVQLGGQAGQKLVYHFKNEAGQQLALIDYLTARKGKGWEVFLLTAAGDGEAADVAMFETFIATFTFTK